MTFDSLSHPPNASSRDRQPLLEPSKQGIVEAIEWEELAPGEEKDRLRLERRVERAFLKLVKLSRSCARGITPQRFYALSGIGGERFGPTRQKSNYWIAGAMVNDILTTICCQTLSTSEYQVRAVAAEQPELQVEVWQQAVIEARKEVLIDGVARKVWRRDWLFPVTNEGVNSP